MSTDGHRDRTPKQVRFAVLTVSDTRTLESDETGQLVIELIQSAYHVATGRAVSRDEPEAVRQLVRQACATDGVDVLVVNGGTGLSRRDTTYEAVRGLYEPELPGFGELFRVLSFEEVGAAAMLSRASAGVVNGRAVFSVPGSPAAARLAMTRLVLPEAPHLVALLQG